MNNSDKSILVITRGKNRGKRICDLSDATLFALWCSWNGIAALKSLPEFQAMSDELDKRSPNRLARKKRLEDINDLPYRIYLKTDHWLRVRRRALKHLGRICNRCGSTRMLHVHHKTYERRGKERIADLEILCETCHRSEHGID